MVLKIPHVVKDLALVLSSSLLLVLSFPDFNLEILAWVGLVPLLLALVGRSLAYGFALAILCGVLFLGGVFNWILKLEGYTLLHHALLALCYGPLFALFGLAFSFVSTRLGILASFLTAPFIWVSLEYIRSNLSFLSIPWGLLAHSQYLNLPVIQIASLTGAYGVSFLVVLVNSALALAILALLDRAGWLRSPVFRTPTRRGTGAVVLSAVAVLTMALLYGQMKLSRPAAGEELRVSVVQGNIEQFRKWDPKYAKLIMQTYAALTREASEDGPALIVWPETATPGSISRHPSLEAQVKRIAREASASLLLGSSQHRKFRNQKSGRARYVNSAHLISPTSGRTQRYDKIRLVPFGEYLPLKGILPWSFVKVPDLSYYVAGKEYTVFETPPFRFGVTICWENIFPDLVRNFVKSGAQFIVNITNEAWFGNTSAPYQFLSMSVFRAVENRIFVVRCANSGVSCFIDQCGRIIGRVEGGNGQDIFVQGVLTERIVPLDSRAFYTRYGDWFPWLSLLCSAIVVGFAFLKERP